MKATHLRAHLQIKWERQIIGLFSCGVKFFLVIQKITTLSIGFYKLINLDRTTNTPRFTSLIKNSGVNTPPSDHQPSSRMIKGFSSAVDSVSTDSGISSDCTRDTEEEFDGGATISSSVSTSSKVNMWPKNVVFLCIRHLKCT